MSNIMMFQNNSKITVLPVPVICIDRANVNTSALLSSSLSAETKALGSDRNLLN